MEALKRANDIRVERAQLRRTSRTDGRTSRASLALVAGVRLDREGVRHADGGARRFRARQGGAVAESVRIGQSKTVGGLSDVQRAELIGLFNR